MLCWIGDLIEKQEARHNHTGKRASLFCNTFPITSLVITLSHPHVGSVLHTYFDVFHPFDQ